MKMIAKIAKPMKQWMWNISNSHLIHLIHLNLKSFIFKKEKTKHINSDKSTHN